MNAPLSLVAASSYDYRPHFAHRATPTRDNPYLAAQSALFTSFDRIRRVFYAEPGRAPSSRRFRCGCKAAHKAKSFDAYDNSHRIFLETVKLLEIHLRSEKRKQWPDKPPHYALN